METSRVSYITESEYNDKFIDMNMVSIVNLDDVTLKQSSEPTEDTSLAGNAYLFDNSTTFCKLLSSENIFNQNRSSAEVKKSNIN